MTSDTLQLPKSQLAGPPSVLLATRYDLRAAAGWDSSSSSLDLNDTMVDYTTTLPTTTK